MEPKKKVRKFTYPVRSIYCHDETWKQLEEQAKKEGFKTVSSWLIQLGKDRAGIK